MLKQFSFLLFFLGFFACKSDVGKVKSILNREVLNSENALDVTIYYSKEGHTKAQLQTPVFKHVITSNPTYVEMPKGLVVSFFDDSLKKISTLSSKYGKLFEHNNNVLVRDSVVVKNDKNEMLETEELIWNEKDQTFFTQKFVKISTPTQVIYGDGLESNQTFTQYKILNVKGILALENKTLPAN